MNYTFSKRQLIGALVKSYELSKKHNDSPLLHCSIQKYKYYLDENIDALYANTIAQSGSTDDE